MSEFFRVQQLRYQRRRRLVFIAGAGATFSAVLCIGILYSSAPTATANAPGRPERAMMDTVSLLVPSQPVEIGTPLKEVPLEEVLWPRSALPEDAVFHRREIGESVARHDIPAMQPLRKEMLLPDRSLLTLPVRRGLRAVTLSIDAVTGLEFFALPGNRVDVVLTSLSAAGPVSRILIENARVLSLGGDSSKPLRRRRGQGPARTITLEVAPPDSLKVATAASFGTLSLLLREGTDTKSPGLPEVTAAEVGNTAFSKRSDLERPARCGSRAVLRMDGRTYDLSCERGSR